MKKILFALALVFGAFTANAQLKASTTAVSLQEGMSTMNYSFTMPNEASEEQINKVKDYYKNYFTVAYDSKSHVAKIHLTENKEMNRKVIQRFLMSSGVQTVTVDGKDMTVPNMYEQYLADKK